MSWEENSAVVLDQGSGLIKCGFAGEDQPRGVFAGVVAKSLLRPQDAPLVGDAALEAATKANAGLTLYYPLEHGIIQDFDNMMCVWDKTFSELQIDAKDYPLVLTEAPMNPNANREKMAQIMFEHYGVPALNIQIQAVMSLYSCGRTDGVVVDSGDGVTHVVPVFGGYCVPTAVRRLDLAGRDLTEWMADLLNEDSERTKRTFSTTQDREYARIIKEQACYVSLDFEKELGEFEEKEEEGDFSGNTDVSLPDGTTFSVGKAKFCCPELLFDPKLNDKECRSVHSTLYNAVQLCPIDTRKTLYNNIVLSGGSTMYKNYDERLRREVADLVPQGARDNVHVVAPPERKYSVWMGAALLASLASFQDQFLTKEEWLEGGASALHARCQALGSFSGK